jgi:type IV pilus assembly protein PilX
MRVSISYDRRQRGVALVVALVFLLMLTILGVSTMNTSALEGRMAGNTQENNRAFQGAESALDSAWKDGSVFALSWVPGQTQTDPNSPFTSTGPRVDVDVTWEATVSTTRTSDPKKINASGKYSTAIFAMKSTSKTATNAESLVVHGVSRDAPGAAANQ